MVFPPWTGPARGEHDVVAPAAGTPARLATQGCFQRCGSLRVIAAKFAVLLDALLAQIKAEEETALATQVAAQADEVEDAPNDQLTILIRELGGKLVEDKVLPQASSAERRVEGRVPVDDVPLVAPLDPWQTGGDPWSPSATVGAHSTRPAPRNFSSRRLSPADWSAWHPASACPISPSADSAAHGWRPVAGNTARQAAAEVRLRKMIEERSKEISCEPVASKEPSSPQLEESALEIGCETTGLSSQLSCSHDDQDLEGTLNRVSRATTLEEFLDLDAPGPSLQQTDDDLLDQAVEQAKAEKVDLERKADKALVALEGALKCAPCPCPRGFPLVAFPQDVQATHPCCGCKRLPPMGSAYAACVVCRSCVDLHLCSDCIASKWLNDLSNCKG